MADSIPDGRGIEAAFGRAAELTGDAREQWLAQLASERPRLAGQIRAWLAGGDGTDPFAAGPSLLADDLTRLHATLAPGTRLGAWRILKPLGVGGMGRVYLAERADGAFAKQVAIKVLRREHRLPPDLLQRERQLLARLEHPGITRILDGGVGADGELYLVMEWVQGEDLAHWCAQRQPTLDQRLDRFEQVVDAVAYAHRELVVHGDIKPNNVLIDGDGRVRLLDFGIARLLGGPQRETPATAAALTPAWAAPECRGGALPDVRADVYALGALLRFVLYGRAPAPARARRSAAAGDATAAMDEPRSRDTTEFPDQRTGENVTAPHAAAAASAAPGSAAPARHGGERTPRAAHGALDAIIARATATRPEDRYRDVAALADDLQRYRTHWPVAARGGGRLYRTYCFVRRHWLAAGAASAITCVLVGATTVVAWQNGVVRAERDRAQLEVARSQTVLDYLIGVLGSAKQSGTTQQPASLRSLLADSLVRINSDFAGDHQARQLLLARLAELHVRLADYTTADSLLKWFQRGEDAEPSPPLLRARVLDNLGIVRLHQNRIDAASGYVDDALGLLRPLRIDSRGLRSELLVTRARIERRQGHAATALATLHKALDLRLAVSAPDASQTVVVRNSLAVSLMRAGRMRDALAQFAQLEQALASSHREHSKDAANIYNNDASTSFAFGLYAQAERLFAKAMTLQRELYGPSAALAALLNNYGKLKLARGDIAAGADMIKRAEAMMIRYAGKDSIDAQLVRVGQGAVAQARGDYARSQAIYTTVADTLAPVLGADHPLMTRLHALSLGARARRVELPADNARFDTLLSALAASPRGDRPRASLMCLRAELALAQYALAQARQSAAACVDLRRKTQALASPTLALAEFLHAEAERRAAPDAAARAQRDARWQQLVEVLGADHPHLERLAALRDG